MFFQGNWTECCVLHDLDYWRGGTSADRELSDQRLRQCVIDKGNFLTGHLMYWGVRFGHLSPIKFGFHWGWGTKPDSKIELHPQYFE